MNKLLKISLLAATLTSATGFICKASANGLLSTKRIEEHDVSKRMAYTIYDKNHQVVTTVFVSSWEELVAFVNALPSGEYWVAQKSTTNADSKRRIIVYTTTN
jgi:hypothetical protein